LEDLELARAFLLHGAHGVKYQKDDACATLERLPREHQARFQTQLDVSLEFRTMFVEALHT
jgi:hypothetical protein